MDYRKRTFTAQPGRSILLTESLKQYSIQPPQKILDIGCGTGELLFSLANTFVTSRVVGIDISLGNIMSINLKNDKPDQIQTVHENFNIFRGENFDAVVSDTSLHLIDDNPHAIFARIKSLMRPGGILVFTAPVACWHNRILWCFRWSARLCRGHFLNNFALYVAKQLYPTWPEPLLTQRLEYLYVLWRWEDSKHLKELLKALGFQLLKNTLQPQISFAKPHHSLSVYRLEK